MNEAVLILVLITLLILLPMLWPAWAIGLIAVLAGKRHDSAQKDPKATQGEKNGTLLSYGVFVALFILVLILMLAGFGSGVTWR